MRSAPCRCGKWGRLIYRQCEGKAWCHNAFSPTVCNYTPHDCTAEACTFNLDNIFYSSPAEYLIYRLPNMGWQILLRRQHGINTPLLKRTFRQALSIHPLYIIYNWSNLFCLIFLDTILHSLSNNISNTSTTGGESNNWCITVNKT